MPEYFDWLCQMAKPDFEDVLFFRLMQALHRRMFYWFVPNDDNRLKDALLLRARAAEDLGVDISELGNSGEASMLEVLLALAERMAFFMEESDYMLMDTVGCFWTLICNFLDGDINTYADDVWDENNCVYFVNCAVDRLLDRTYEPDGNGGLFPLQHPNQDQRGIEIWWQMMAFLLENFPV